MQNEKYQKEKCYRIEGNGADLSVTEISIIDANTDQDKGGIPVETIVVVEEYACGGNDIGDCLIRALCSL